MSATGTPVPSQRSGAGGYWKMFKAKKREEYSQTMSQNRKRARMAIDNSQYEMMPMCGIQVKLPLGISPYPTQKLMMTRIITSLNLRKNVLAESPTGSGKTLALLASTCAWLVKYKEDRIKARKSCAFHSENRRSDVDSSQSEKKIAPELLETPTSTKGLINDDGFVDQSNFDDEDGYSKEFLDDFMFPAELTGSPSVSSVQKEKNGSDPNTTKKPATPACTCLPKVRIYYGTRTHKQIGQVVKEFSRLPYGGVLRHTVMASREQTCINPSARQSFDITSHCKELIGRDGIGCNYKANMKGYENPVTMRRFVESHAPVVFDIEDLVDGLRSSKPSMCPYFTATRVLTSDADIVFCPFSYLVDPIIRESSDVTLKNSIVILDEAHNIEDTCREGASFTFFEKELADALHSFKTKEHAVAEALTRKSSSKKLDLDENDFIAVDDGVDKIQEMKDYRAHLTLCSNFLSTLWDWFEESSKPVGMLPEKFNGLRSATRKWNDLTVSLLKIRSKGMSLLLVKDSNEFKAISDAFRAVASAGMDSNKETNQNDLSVFRPSSAAIVVLEKWLYFLDFFSKEGNRKMYSMNVRMEKTNSYFSQAKIQGEGSFDGQGPKNNMYSTAEAIWLDNTGPSGLRPVADGFKTSISLWCMSPSLSFLNAFEDARCVILASGTLCPMGTLKTELGMEFNTEVEGNQVVPSEQIFAAVLPVGPTGRRIVASMSSMKSDGLIMLEIASVVRNICLTVPCGVLCFLPSYKMMQDLQRVMQTSNIENDIIKRKVIIEEPRRPSDLNSKMFMFDDAIENPKKYGAEIDGALMLAVFRGKISEGIDFADDKARVVISVGIPYPNWGDEQVQEKRRYNDENSKIMGILDAESWYTTQAYRALNQALGRCLRHKNDWGALVLLDDRLCVQSSRVPKPIQTNKKLASSAAVSRWIRDQLVVFRRYNEFESQLSSFTTKMRAADAMKQ